MLKNLKLRVSNYLLRYLFNAVTEDSFLQIQFDTKNKNNVILKGGEPLHESKIQELAQESRAILRMSVFQLVLDSMRWTSNDMIQNKSKNIDDITFGKACLYTIDVLEKKIANIAKL